MPPKKSNTRKKSAASSSSKKNSSVAAASGSTRRNNGGPAAAYGSSINTRVPSVRAPDFTDFIPSVDISLLSIKKLLADLNVNLSKLLGIFYTLNIKCKVYNFIKVSLHKFLNWLLKKNLR